MDVTLAQFESVQVYQTFQTVQKGLSLCELARYQNLLQIKHLLSERDKALAAFLFHGQ